MGRKSRNKRFTSRADRIADRPGVLSFEEFEQLILTRSRLMFESSTKDPYPCFFTESARGALAAVTFEGDVSDKYWRSHVVEHEMVPRVRACAAVKSALALSAWLVMKEGTDLDLPDPRVSLRDHKDKIDAATVLVYSSRQINLHFAEISREGGQLVLGDWYKPFDGVNQEAIAQWGRLVVPIQEAMRDVR